MTAMLRVSLREHHEFDVGRVAPQSGERVVQVIDLVFGERQTPLSVRLLETPRAAKRDRKSADEMAIIIEDLVKLLDAVGGRLKHGQYPERQGSRQLATMLRRVADDFDV